jgi:hypothetical protein
VLEAPWIVIGCWFVSQRVGSRCGWVPPGELIPLEGCGTVWRSRVSCLSTTHGQSSRKGHLLHVHADGIQSGYSKCVHVKGLPSCCIDHEFLTARLWGVLTNSTCSHAPVSCRIFQHPASAAKPLKAVGLPELPATRVSRRVLSRERALLLQYARSSCRLWRCACCQCCFSRPPSFMLSVERTLTEPPLLLLQVLHAVALHLLSALSQLFCHRLRLCCRPHVDRASTAATATAAGCRAALAVSACVSRPVINSAGRRPSQKRRATRAAAQRG